MNLSIDFRRKMWSQFWDEKCNKINYKIDYKDESELFIAWNQWLNNNCGITMEKDGQFFYSGNILIYNQQLYTLFLLKFSN
jgi:hypothetical protein